MQQYRIYGAVRENEILICSTEPVIWQMIFFFFFFFHFFSTILLNYFKHEMSNG